MYKNKYKKMSAFIGSFNNSLFVLFLDVDDLRTSILIFHLFFLPLSKTHSLCSPPFNVSLL